MLHFCIVKNLLIIISSERILIHDMKEKVNQCYIPIFEGESAFVHMDYYNLQVCYYIENLLLCSRSIWLNRINRVEGVKFSCGCFTQDG